MNKPNIIFLFTDDLRFDTINALGNKQIITPNIDKLVAQGVTFTHCHIPGGTDPAVCMPSRAMVNTGRTLFHLENAGQEIPLEHELLGETLQRNGYYTYGIGKWHNGLSAFNRSFTGGSKIFFGGMADHWQVPSFEYDSTGKYDSKMAKCVDCNRGKDLTYINGDTLNSGKHSTDLLQEVACDFIENYSDTRPYYLYFSFLAPHDPRTMPQEYLDMYKDIEIELPPNFMSEYPFDLNISHIRGEHLAQYPRDSEEIKEHIKDYYAMITHVDFAIGKVIESVEKSGQLDNTIFIFAGDNGLGLGQHAIMAKQSLFDHSVRVPLIFSGSNIPANIQSDSLVYLLDIYPTICEILDIEKPASVDGVSMLQTILNADVKDREYLYLAYEGTQRGVTNGKYKFIEYAIPHSPNHQQFFDLIADPYELNNLYNCEEYFSLIATFKEKLNTLSYEWDDHCHVIGKKYWQQKELNSHMTV